MRVTALLPATCLAFLATAAPAQQHSGQPLRGLGSFAAGSMKTRRRTRRPWPSSKASNTGRPPDPRPRQVRSKCSRTASKARPWLAFSTRR